jgi:methyltransferase
LIFFGGLNGIEGIIEELEENTTLKASEAHTLFDEYVNSCPERGCRNTSVRTEESLLISLGAMMPKLRYVGKANTKKAMKK